ncbi:lipopolysaccharide biosynthesis protein [Chryseobacterium sp. cx-311]|uniref:lipopolysaccharide biosynthesis protein n=1 Tax=Marnyiella aurantia TaxID=2758037 RepID=UPI001AE4815D|nr:lipopolysaccharide biosynthesis protein [Marnyiella aurantia]MBP0612936.1 lipopolysaccharide biosynthesis protein [Marnyiella aurantia]
MSLKQQALSGMLWSSIQTFGNQFISFGVSIILARLLLPAEFGLIGMIGIFMGIGGALISSGLSASLIRTTNPDQADYSTVFVFNLVGSIVVYALIFMAAPYIASFFKQQILVEITRLYSLSFIISAFTAVQITRLHKHMNFKSETRASLISTLVSGVLGIALAYLGFGVMSLVWMGLAGALVNTVMLWVQSGWKPSLLFDKQKFRYHFGFGSRMMFSGILDILFTNAYIIIIGKFYAPAQLGYYNRADSLKQLPVSTFSGILNKVTYPLFAEIKNDDVRLKSVYKQIMKMVIFIIAPVLVIMGVLGEPLFRFLFTEKWLPAVPYFQIMCAAGILYPLHAYNLNILSVKGRSDLFLRLEIIKKLLLVGVLAASFPFGILGLIWGQVIFSMIAFFINTHYSGKFLKYSSLEQLQDITPLLLLAALSGAGTYAISYFLSDSHDAVRLVAGGFSGMLFFLILARVFRLESGQFIADLLKKKLPASIPIPFIKYL